MDCPNCSTPHPEAARFCSRCGTPLHPAIQRSRHFAAHPEEPVRSLAVVSTLMPHLAGGRHHIYRGAIGLALLAALIAAAFGMLSVALILAAIALPAAVLTFMHDHDLWRGEPISVLGLALLTSLALGVGVGMLEHHLTKPVLLAGPRHRMPTMAQVLELGILVPAVTFVAVLIPPVLVTARSAFRHSVDAVAICSLSGAAFSLGLSVAIQRGAFSHLGATAGNPAHVAFIALTLGFLQPIIFATAAAMALVPLRGVGVNTVSGLAKGLALLVLYGLATVLLAPYGTRGIVLTTLAALVLGAAGLLGVRYALHVSLLAEAQAALTGAATLARAPGTRQVCAHCGAMIEAEAAFCQVCGTATAALARHPAPDDGNTTVDVGATTAAEPAAVMPATPPRTPPPLQFPGNGVQVGHRLRPVTVAAVIVVIVLVAAAVTVLIVLSGTTGRTKLPPMLPGGHAEATAPAGSGLSQPVNPPTALPPAVRGARLTLTSANAIAIADGISITPAPGWTLTDRGPNWVTLFDPNNTAAIHVTVKPADGTDAAAVLQGDVNQLISAPSTGLTNVNVMGAPTTKTLQSEKFQQAASMNYTADFSAQLGITHLIGVFMELLNTSNHQSAFIDYRETSDVSASYVGAAQMMIDSML